ncbi:Dihydroxy-acid dehydratase [subsurface metagenome]
MRSDIMKKGYEKAPHRSLMKAMGLKDEDIAKPIIGIANAANEIVPGHIHLDKLAKEIKKGIREAGGTPIEFGIIGICDGIAMNHPGMKYSLASRELIADSVESMAIAHPFDGLALLTNCDKITPGMLMAAARLNIPAIIISGGPMLTGKYKGEDVDLINVFEGVGKVAIGKMTEEELKELEDVACPGEGCCAGIFTANSMNCLSEALGMALPGNGTILAVSNKRKELARLAGKQIMELVKKDIKPLQIMTKEAFETATCFTTPPSGARFPLRIAIPPSLWRGLLRDRITSFLFISTPLIFSPIFLPATVNSSRLKRSFSANSFISAGIPPASSRSCI